MRKYALPRPRDTKAAGRRGSGGPRNPFGPQYPAKEGMMPYPVITREEAGPLISAKKLRPAFLHETDNAKLKFVYVKLGSDFTRLYRVIEPPTR